MVAKEHFLEFAEVHGNFYGTPKPCVLERAAAGFDTVLKIDVQGGLTVKKQIPEAVMIFLVPPSLDELERRLRSRLTESEEQIAKRLLDARTELEQIPYYEYIVENDTIEEAASQLKAIIIAERHRIMPPC
jgi:guanylate kinase